MEASNNQEGEGPSAKRPRLEDVVWPTKKCDFASNVFKKIYLDEKSADAHFLCGAEEERIPAHKNVLSKSSLVFDTMFYGSLANDSDKKLPETPPQVFKTFLRFCYSDEVNLNPSTITEVMKLLHE